MKEAIYSWIKCLAIFYILLTMLIHLVPTGKYQRYVRFFMGLLLMAMLITPMLSILEKAKTLPESFSSLYQQEEKKRLTHHGRARLRTGKRYLCLSGKDNRCIELRL